MVSGEVQPVVTGISPAEGPPGTIVKIRGENLGKSENDLLGKNNIFKNFGWSHFLSYPVNCSN